MRSPERDGASTSERSSQGFLRSATGVVAQASQDSIRDYTRRQEDECSNCQRAEIHSARLTPVQEVVWISSKGTPNETCSVSH
jgi:hypothetical protein